MTQICEIILSKFTAAVPKDLVYEILQKSIIAKIKIKGNFLMPLVLEKLKILNDYNTPDQIKSENNFDKMHL